MKTTLFLILSCGWSYLFGAFYSASFDISLWAVGVRYTSLCLTFLAIITYFMHNYLSDKPYIGTHHDQNY